MKKIIILEGGSSSEREVSLISAQEIFTALAPYYDCVKIDTANFPTIEQLISSIRKEEAYMIFNALHGGDGENGNLQAVLELANLPYTGSSSLASKIAMDKYLSKIIAQDLNIPVPKFFLWQNHQPITDLTLDFTPPYVVKPNNGGSSVGITKVETPEHLIPAVKTALKYDNNVLIEEFIPGKELTVTILGNNTYPVVEIRPKKGWYDFQNKYTKGNTAYICPAEITKEESELVQQMALSFFKRIRAEVYGRIDFRFDGNNFYFLEANTLPGMTKLSLTPLAVKNKGIDFTSLLDNIIQLSTSKYQQ